MKPVECPTLTMVKILKKGLQVEMMALVVLSPSLQGVVRKMFVAIIL